MPNNDRANAYEIPSWAIAMTLYERGRVKSSPPEENMDNGDGLVFRATLRDGTPVVGKMYKGEVVPATYANRTQANVRASFCGGVVIRRGRPWYVVLPPQKEG